jgi:hypothetical protein
VVDGRECVVRAFDLLLVRRFGDAEKRVIIELREKRMELEHLAFLLDVEIDRFVQIARVDG